MPTHRHDTRLGALALLAGAAFVVLTAVHLTHPAFDDRLTTTADYLNDGSFTVALVCTIPCLLALGGPAIPTRLAVAGQALVVTGVVSGLITGESPSWFAAVGVPGVLAILVGTAWLGVSAWRGGWLPRPAAGALALTALAGIIAAEAGGAIVPGLLWLWFGACALSLTPRRTPGRGRAQPARPRSARG